MSFKQAKHQQGFSLIELLIYITILAVLVMLLTEFLSKTLLVSSKYETTSEINHNARLIINRLSQETRWAAEVKTSESLFNQDAGKLVLVTSHGEISFYLDNQAIYEQDGTYSPKLLRNNKLAVDKFKIAHDEIKRLSEQNSFNVQLKLIETGRATSTREFIFNIDMRNIYE